MKKLQHLLVVLMLAVLALMSAATLALAADAPTGNISATLRVDYVQRLSKLSACNLQMELLQGNKLLGQAPLTAAAELKLGEYDAVIGLRDADSGELNAGGDWPAYIDIEIGGLAPGAYTLRFSGTGYKTFTQDIKIDDHSQHLIFGTADATLTLGDLNGDGRIDSKDQEVLAAHLGSGAAEDLAVYDLNGDGQINIIDLAYIVRNVNGTQKKTLPAAEILPTFLLQPADGRDLEAAISAADTVITEGEAGDMLRDNGQTVSLTAAGKADVVIPISLTEPQDLAEVQITSPEGEHAIKKGEVLVEYTDGTTEVLPFDNTLPADIHAIGRVEGQNTVTVNLGKKIPVKKITITVTRVEDSFVTVESILFLQNIVPETPVVANNMVKKLTAAAGDGAVTLSWSKLANVTGYQVSYYPTDKPKNTQTKNTDKTSITISGLKNLTEYTFTVTPTSDGWQGKPQSVTATPLPAKAPDAPDMVNVSAQDQALHISWKAGKNATYYEVYYTDKKDAALSSYKKYGGKLTTTQVFLENLTNGMTYYIYVVAGNDIGKSGASRISTGTPQAIVYERPAGIPTKGILDYTVVKSVALTAANNYSPTAYPKAKPFKPSFMADGDYATHWTSHSYGDGNWWDNKQVVFTFREPVDISSVIWVPRLDGGYANNLRVYTVTVWQQGDDLNGPGRRVAGRSAAVADWLPVKGSPTVNKFAVLPITPSQEVVKMAVTIEQRAYTAVSLSEVLFMEYDPAHSLPDNIDALFADDLHSRLSAGVDQAAIDALSDRLNSEEKDYYLNTDMLADELALAQELLLGQKSSGVMIDGVSSRSSSIDAKKYQQGGSQLQPLGVAAKAGDEITVYAEGIPDGEALTVYATQFNAEASAWQAQVGRLENGRNILTIPKIGSQNTQRGGSLYFAYTGAEPEQIKLHIRRAQDIPVLELADWYDLSEDSRRAKISDYIAELTAYQSIAGIKAENRTTNVYNVTEISTPSVLLSLPAAAALTGLGSGSEADKVEVLYRDVLAWEDLMSLCRTTQGIDGELQSRQNIRCMQMFSGAFMYAAGNHIGIGYGSCAGMMTGRPLSRLSEGAKANGLFGWGIAHEIGHNMDKLGRAEITNNIYSLIAQTADGGQNLLPSRLEKSNKYAAIFNKTAQAQPGASGDVFVQLGLYWQLKLAYDDPAEPLQFYHDFFTAWKSGDYFGAGASYDDKVALTAAGVTRRDLTEFCRRWGMELSESTEKTLAGYAAEPRAIWYLNDNSRRARYSNEAAASGTLAATAKLSNNNEVTITIAPEINGAVQGYEISRNGRSIAFVAEPSYTDIIGAGNHRTYTYTVAAYDVLGNKIGEAEAAEIRIAYDSTIDPKLYTVSYKGADAVITLKENTPVAGFKLSGGTLPEGGNYAVSVSSGDKTNIAKVGSFADNRATDDKAAFLAYFSKPGAAEDDSRIWTHDADSVTIKGLPQNAGLNIELLADPGDDVSLLAEGFAGKLAADYVYGDKADEKIAAGTLVIVGNYRGDPVFNGVKIKGRFIQNSNADDTAEAKITERYLDGETLLFAELPADGAVSDISDGIFIFVPNVQKEAELQGEISSCAAENLLPAQIKAEIFRTDDPNNAENKRTTAETLWFAAPGGEALPTIILEADK